MEFWNKEKILKEFKISNAYLNKLRLEGLPKPVRSKGFEIKSFCEWIVARPQKRKDRTKIREIAQKILIKLLSKQEKNTGPEKTKESAQKQSRTRAKIEPGLLQALERARQAEVDAYKAHIDFLRKSGIVNASLLGTWQSTLDILRNCEKDFTKVLESRRELVQMKEVVDFFEPMIEQTKAILLNLAAKVAPGLEGMPWQDIEKKLDQEIRHALSKLTNFS